MTALPMPHATFGELTSQLDGRMIMEMGARGGHGRHSQSLQRAMGFTAAGDE